ncbi:hypothetical protein BKA59DRAFT_459234 [Fusarium tricinctum]|uniref:Mid2 domain-containing protein n=1 Tax=Fusarium tricinctum TaxID=61284 RepID=A0A8K0W6U0_9HYPO|nr:hypothetical protein BKA59DRAFT_459234 [Fusarium tricinctum]
MERHQSQDTDKSEKVSQPQNENLVDKTSSKSIFTTITLFNLPHGTQSSSFPTLDEPSTNRIITLWSETPTTHSAVRAWYTRIQTVFLTELDGEIHTLDDNSSETSTGSETQETSTASETSVVDKTTTTSETTTTLTIVSETLLSSALPLTSSQVLAPSSTWSTSYTTTSSSEIWSTLTLTIVPSNPSTSDSNGISPAEGVGISVGAVCGFLLIIGSILLVVFRCRLSDEPPRSRDNQNNININLDNSPVDHTVAEPQSVMPNEWKAS